MPPRASWTRQEVLAMKPKWRIIRDCLGGEEAIKGERSSAYLPLLSVETDADTLNRYTGYLQRAVFYNVTARTLNGMVGQVYSKAPVLELPKALELMRTDIDGSGISLEQQSKKVLRNVLGLGRAGLLADFPKASAGVSKADLAKGFIRPQILSYNPEQIINWRVEQVGGRILLKLLVLEREIEDNSDAYEIRMGKEWRVYRRTPAGVTLEIFTESGTGAATEARPVVILDHTGKAFDEIPFVFVGVENNDPALDSPPLYDMAILNIGHYRNSADFEESSFVTGQPTIFMAGMTEHWVTKVLKGVIRMGARGGIPGPPGSSAVLLQAQPNTLPGAGMQTKEQQMVALGARLVQMQVVQRTATEASQDKVSEVSVLASSARNTSAAYAQVFKYAGMFIGADTASIVFALTTDYAVAKLTPQEQLQLVASWQAGAITDGEMRFNMRQGGLAQADDATWETETAEKRKNQEDVMAGSQLPGASNTSKGKPKPK